MHFLIVLLVMVMEVVFWYLAKSWIQTWSVHHLSRPVFETSHHRKGTVIDSGTTLGYLAEDAYNPFVDAVTKSVPQSVQPFDAKGYRCFVTKKSVSEVFPTVSFNFAGDASMVLKPENYLLKQKTVDGETAWCIGFQKVKGQGLTILGDIVLKDKTVKSRLMCLLNQVVAGGFQTLVECIIETRCLRHFIS